MKTILEENSHTAIYMKVGGFDKYQMITVLGDNKSMKDRIRRIG